jgi:ketosteroid isomerase-like protein
VTSLEQDIVALDRAWEDAIIDEDAAMLERLGSPDLIYTHAAGWTEDKDGFIRHVLDGPLRFPVIRYEDTEVRLHASAAVLTAALHLETLDRDGKAGELHFRITHVWCRDAEAWRLVASQSTHIPSAASRTA